jgi:heterodisulfide reductase subunit B
VGIDALKKRRKKVFKDLNIAVHYGCHALRPSNLTQFDNPASPTLFDDLVEVTGAKSVDWALKLECCGGPLLGINDDLSLRLTGRKLADGKKAGAQYLCTACPYCHIQFDGVQKNAFSLEKYGKPLPPILYPQLLGLSLGLDQRLLGLERNQLSIGDMVGLLTEE